MFFYWQYWIQYGCQRTLIFEIQANIKDGFDWSELVLKDSARDNILYSPWVLVPLPFWSRTLATTPKAKLCASSRQFSGNPDSSKRLRKYEWRRNQGGSGKRRCLCSISQEAEYKVWFVQNRSLPIPYMNITLIFCPCTADGFPITKERRKVIIDAQKTLQYFCYRVKELYLSGCGSMCPTPFRGASASTVGLTRFGPGGVRCRQAPRLICSRSKVSSGPWPGLVRSPFCQVGSGRVSISRAYRLTVSVRFQVFIWSCQVEVRWCPGGFWCPLSLFSSPNQVITKGCSSSYEMKESRGQDFVLTPLQVRFPWRCTSSDQILPFLQSSGSKFTLSLISNNDDCAEVEDGWLVFRLCSKSFFWRYSVHNDDVLIWWW